MSGVYLQIPRKKYSKEAGKHLHIGSEINKNIYIFEYEGEYAHGGAVVIASSVEVASELLKSGTYKEHENRLVASFPIMGNYTDQIVLDNRDIS